MGRSYQVAAHAKLNLRLKIEGRRADGYHLLSMLNVLMGFADKVELTFSEAGGVGIEVVSELNEAGDDALLSTERNLAAVAARLVLDRFKIPLGVRIVLTKRIPLGAGLGGGSSDAGAVIRFLVRCFEDYVIQDGIIPREEFTAEVIKLAAAVGSDVPFFVRGGFARVTGVGDIIEQYDARFVAGVRCLVVLPRATNPTKSVYDAFRKAKPVIPMQRDLAGEQYGEALRLNTPTEGYEPFPSRTIKASLWRQLLTLVHNDLEATVAEFSPIVGETLAKLRRIPDTVSGITGSGSGMFVLPKTLDYFNKNGTGMVREALAGSDLNIVETELVPSAAPACA